MTVALCGLIAAAAVGAAGDVPGTMRAVSVKGLLGCKAPDFPCIQMKTVSTPTPKSGEALILVNASSVNPADVDYVEAPAGGVVEGTIGHDLSGVVVECPGCARLKAGDKVWAFASHAYADYAVVDEARLGLAPTSLSPVAAGTIPVVGLTSAECLKRTGAPWAQRNLTVVVTSGTGGTGFIGVQLAKAYGAARIITAASGADNIAFIKSLGADEVIDYKQQDIFEALGNDSVDVVYDNYGAPGTADKAIRTIRAGGAYLILPHRGCLLPESCLSKTKKAGVQQINFGLASVKDVATLDELKELFDAGKLKAHVQRTFPLSDVPAAFALSASGTVVGKVAVAL